MITDWLDNALRYFADHQGRPVDEYSAQVGGEGIATALEFMADQFAQPLLSTLLQLGASVLSGAYATWAPGVSTRTRRELAAISIHEGLRVSKMLHPPFSFEVQSNLQSVLSASQRGDSAGVMMALLKSPAESLGVFAARPAAPPTAPTERAMPYTPAPVPEIKSEMVGPAFGERAVPYGAIVSQAPFGAQATVGRYTVTEQAPYGQESPGIGRYS